MDAINVHPEVDSTRYFSFDDVDVDTVDLGSVSGKPADIYVTTRELFDNLPEDIKPKTIVLTNFIDKADIESHLVPKIKEIQGN